MQTDEILARVGKYYGDRLIANGCTAAGVDWKSQDSQEARFDKLLEVATVDDPFTINDYGCGYGGLADYLHARQSAGRYRGYDVSEVMIQAAKSRHAGGCGCTFTRSRAAMSPADYTVASGIFNVITGVSVDRWRDYVLETIRDIAALSTTGFAFNVLSSHVSLERRRPNLFYADPQDLWSFVVRDISPQVALLHDYWPHEFTMIVRLPRG